MGHSKSRGQARGRAAQEAPIPRDHEFEALRQVGIPVAQARRQYQLRTVVESSVYLLCWAIVILALLPSDRTVLKWQHFPRHATTVVADPARLGHLMLQWVDASGLPHDYQPDDSDHVKLGQKITIVDGPTYGCGYETTSDVKGDAITMVAFNGVIPTAGLGLLIAHRVRQWRRLRRSQRNKPLRGYEVSAYHASWRTFLAITYRDKTWYVPMMRGQGLSAVEDPTYLQPLVAPYGRAQIPFRVVGTDRTVWPAGACHPSIWPVAQMGVTILRLFGPMLLIPLARYMASSPIC